MKYTLTQIFHLLQASAREVVWVMRVAAVFFCAIATVLAITVQSIYGLLHMCGDVVYVVLFPQLVCVMFVPWFNTFGSLIGESNISFLPHG